MAEECNYSCQKMICFSVIIPVYNSLPFLRECIDSVVSAGGKIPGFEVIAVDDASTDGSGELLDEYERDKKIRVLHCEHHGVGAARNVGLMSAQGEYIVFVDSDDIVAEDFFVWQLKLFAETNADILHYRFRYLQDENNQFVHGPSVSRLVADGHEKAIWTIHALFDVGYSCLFSFKRALISVKWPEDMRVYEDVIWALQLIQQAEVVCDTDYDGYGYRQHGDSVTSKRSPVMDVFRYIIRSYRHIRVICKKNNLRFGERLPVYLAYCRRIRHLLK